MQMALPLITTDDIVALLRLAATTLPSDVKEAIENASSDEQTPGGVAIRSIIENIHLAEKNSLPMCQDTGMLIFYVRCPQSVSGIDIQDVIRRGVEIATTEIPLRPNAVNSKDKNTGNNLGENFPLIHFEPCKDEKDFRIRVLLKGGGSENVGRLYSLPDSSIGATRNAEGVRACVLDAAQKAQGKGCPPEIIGVAVGGARDQVTHAAKEQFFRPLNDTNKDEILAKLEAQLYEEINSLGIGASGLGGTPTTLGVKIDWQDRHAATFWVEVSFLCWAARRGELIYNGTEFEVRQ